MFNDVITLLFVVELSVKAHVLGLETFVKCKWNVFEAAVVVLSFLGVVVSLGVTSSPFLLTWALFARQFRVLRLLRSLPQFKFLTATIVALGPQIAPFVGVVFLFFFGFGVVGNGLFGDLVLPLVERRANEFHDFAGALLTLFELAVVNNWNFTMDSYFRAGGERRWIQAYFVAWYVLAVQLLLNGVTSFVLDALDAEFHKTDDGRNGSESAAESPRRRKAFEDDVGLPLPDIDFGVPDAL